jgi:hypothetical protein
MVKRDKALYFARDHAQELILALPTLSLPSLSVHRVDRSNRMSLLIVLLVAFHLPTLWNVENQSTWGAAPNWSVQASRVDSRDESGATE